MMMDVYVGGEQAWAQTSIDYMRISSIMTLSNRSYPPILLLC